MTTDEQVVQESDFALIEATLAFERASAVERLKMAGELRQARESWGTARFRLLFPDTVSSLQDVAEARALRGRIETAADKQKMAQALLDLAGLLAKFAH